jgi:hypothetical protein
MRLSPAPRKRIRQLTLHRGVRETAAQCFESGGDFNPISAEQLRQLVSVFSMRGLKVFL